jgi:hypothetical protein
MTFLCLYMHIFKYSWQSHVHVFVILYTHDSTLKLCSQQIYVLHGRTRSSFFCTSLINCTMSFLSCIRYLPIYRCSSINTKKRANMFSTAVERYRQIIIFKKYLFMSMFLICCTRRPQWPRGLRHAPSSTARTLE